MGEQASQVHFAELMTALLNWVPPPRSGDGSVPLCVDSQGQLAPPPPRLPDFHELYAVYLTVYRAAPEALAIELKEYLVFLERMRVQGDALVLRWDRDRRWAMARGAPQSFSVALIGHDFHTTATVHNLQRLRAAHDRVEAAAARVPARAGDSAGTGSGYCFHYNSAQGNTCTYRNCSFPHVCEVCGGDHPAYSGDPLQRCTASRE